MYTILVLGCSKCGRFYGCIQEKVHVLCTNCTHTTECKFVCAESVSGGGCPECTDIAVTSVRFRNKMVYGC